MRRPQRSKAGFTFLEILIVMAVMGILMGIGIGYLQNIGTASRVDQSRAILRETLYACKQSSNGGTRAIFELRERPRDGELVVGASVARNVMTHNFEEVDTPSQDYPVEVQGTVEIVPGGHIGRCASFNGGGRLVFEPQSAFAMTEGLEISVWLLPVAGATTMTLLQGAGAYELQLARESKEAGYDVLLQLELKEPGVTGRSVGTRRTFRTKGGPVHADARWVHLQVSYDGADASIRVDGLERETLRRARRRGTASTAEDEGMRQIVVPEGGVVTLSIGGTNTPYSGLMDTLVLGGVFRSADAERELFGLDVVRRKLPIRVVYRNGRLDPARHPGDVVLLLQEESNQGGPLLEFRLGMYGTVDEGFVRGDAP